MNLKICLVVLVLVSMFCVAGNASAITEQERLTLIAQIQQQLISLIQQVQQMLATWTYTFYNSLGYANSGTDEVAKLHIALYKEGISYAPDGANVYSTGTLGAVKTLQSRYGITPTGYFGLLTRNALNQRNGSTANTACTPSWQCTGFSACTNGQQTRTCTDSYNCGTTTNRPSLSQSCTTTNTNTNNCSAVCTTQLGIAYAVACNGTTVTTCSTTQVCQLTYNTTSTYVNNQIQIARNLTGSQCTTPTPVFTTIRLTPAPISLVARGSTGQLTATTLDQNGLSMYVSSSLTWASNNREVATVDSYGTITPLTVGTTSITVSSGSITSNVSVVTVTVPNYTPVLTSINITPTTVSLNVGGGTQQLTAATLDQFNVPISTTVTWSSSTPTVATVIAGLVTPVSIGTTNITASSGGVPSIIPSVVTVSSSPSINVTSPTTNQILINGTTHNITWNSTGISNVLIIWTKMNAPNQGTTGWITPANTQGRHVVANTGTYPWTIPSDLADGQYIVQVFNYDPNTPGPANTYAVDPVANSEIFNITSPVVAPMLASITISPATNITTTTATLNGNITNTGGNNPIVTMYWGTTYGGQIAENWTNNSAPTSPSQPQGSVAFSKNITGLTPGTTYYFSAKATNSIGTNWSISYATFTTNPAPLLNTINISIENTTITVGSPNQYITATTLDQYGNPIFAGVQWISDNHSAATVNASGLITPIATGTTAITALNGTIRSNELIINVIN